MSYSRILVNSEFTLGPEWSPTRDELNVSLICNIREPRCDILKDWGRHRDGPIPMLSSIAKDSVAVCSSPVSCFSISLKSKLVEKT